MPSALPGGALDRLRCAVAKIDPGRVSSLEQHGGGLRFRVPALDSLLQGGLGFGALHEVTPAGPLQLGAAFGFAVAVTALAVADGRHVLLIETDFGALEGGNPYGPGLDLFGLPLDRVLLMRVAHPRDALWAFEEALKCPALAAIVAELPEAGAAADPVATRRLSLAAQAGGGLGLLLRHRPSPLPTAAMTRWQVAGALSQGDRYGGLGRTTFDLCLNRNRRGRCGRVLACWNHDEQSFLPQALSLGMAATARDRSDRAPLRRTA
jgi:protein ImuA